MNHYKNWILAVAAGFIFGSAQTALPDSRAADARPAPSGHTVQLVSAHVGEFSPRAREARSAQPREGVLVPASALPEPDGWMLLLCGLIAVGVIARRRSNL